jgi:hypothetical protein
MTDSTKTTVASKRGRRGKRFRFFASPISKPASITMSRSLVSKCSGAAGEWRRSTAIVLQSCYVKAIKVRQECGYGSARAMSTRFMRRSPRAVRIFGTHRRTIPRGRVSVRSPTSMVTCCALEPISSRVSRSASGSMDVAGDGFPSPTASGVSPSDETAARAPALLLQNPASLCVRT